MKKKLFKITILIFILTIMHNFVYAQSVLYPTIKTFNVTPTSIKLGEYIDIEWESEDALYCNGSAPTENDLWNGEKSKKGKERVYPIATATQQNSSVSYEYKITCYKKLGSNIPLIGNFLYDTTKSVKIQVNIPASPVCKSPEILDSTGQFCFNPNKQNSFTDNKPVSNLFVQTNGTENITQNTATIYGTGGDNTPNPTLPITAYFRYSNAKKPPIYCNDIYGINMVTTKDIKLGNKRQTNFSANLTNLIPDTTYYYCAIISNNQNIAYGGESVVKSFHTSPTKTTAITKDASNIKQISATLNGTYSSVKDIKIYFKYRENVDIFSLNTILGTNTSAWKTVGEKKYSIGRLDNINGNISLVLNGLKPATKYTFYVVAEDKDETINGEIKSFTTETASKTGGGVNNDTIGNENQNCPDNYTGIYPNCIPNIICNSSQIYHPASNSCIENIYCVSPRMYGSYSSCDKIDPVFCQKNPTSTICVSENEWIKNNKNSNNGNNCIWENGVWNCNSDLKLGSIAIPPNDAVVRNMEGIENVFVRQIINDTEMASVYGYKDGEDIQKFAWYLADNFAKAFGYVNSKGKEIRVSKPNIAAYQLKLIGNDLGVYEYYNNKIVDIRKITPVFKNRSDYEYYFKK